MTSDQRRMQAEQSTGNRQMCVGNRRLTTFESGLTGKLRAVGCFTFVLFLALTASGCKKSSGGVPVHGHISYRGEALVASSVTFFPAQGRPITATAPQGDYAAELMPGYYTVSVTVGIEYPPGFKEGDPIPMPKVVLPPEYSTRSQSTLKATVTSEQSEPIDFSL